MSSDNDHSHSSAPHDGHDGPPPATDIIPENSPQDLVLKIVAVVGAFLISGSFVWWWLQPLSASVEGNGAAEEVQH